MVKLPNMTSLDNRQEHQLFSFIDTSCVRCEAVIPQRKWNMITQCCGLIEVSG